MGGRIDIQTSLKRFRIIFLYGCIPSPYESYIHPHKLNIPYTIYGIGHKDRSWITKFEKLLIIDSKVCPSLRGRLKNLRVNDLIQEVRWLIIKGLLCSSSFVFVQIVTISFSWLFSSFCEWFSVCLISSTSVQVSIPCFFALPFDYPYFYAFRPFLFSPFSIRIDRLLAHILVRLSFSVIPKLCKIFFLCLFEIKTKHNLNLRNHRAAIRYS